MKAFRIEKEIHLSHIRTGEGAFLYGGRWNSAGNRMIYASSSLSLALLEILVHTPSLAVLKSPRQRVEIDISDTLIQSATLSASMDPFGPKTLETATQKIGDDWLESETTVGLLVPSVIVPSEYNLLLNPRHPQFDRLKWSPPVPVVLDPRLWRV